MIAGTCRACLSISDALGLPFVRNKDPRAMQPLARAGELPRSTYFRLHDPLIRGITSTIFAASLRRCIDLPTSTASRGVLGFTTHSHSTYVSSAVRQFRTPLVSPFVIHHRLPPRAFSTPRIRMRMSQRRWVRRSSTPLIGPQLIGQLDLLTEERSVGLEISFRIDSQFKFRGKRRDSRHGATSLAVAVLLRPRHERRSSEGDEEAETKHVWG